MMFTVDRIEGSFAVCEDSNGDMVNIHLDKLPVEVRSGDILNLRDGQFLLERSAADKRRNKLSALQDKVLNKCTERSDRSTH